MKDILKRSRTSVPMEMRLSKKFDEAREKLKLEHRSEPKSDETDPGIIQQHSPAVLPWMPDF